MIRLSDLLTEAASHMTVRMKPMYIGGCIGLEGAQSMSYIHFVGVYSCRSYYEVIKGRDAMIWLKSALAAS